MACCVSGGAVVEAGSGDAAPWQRLQAAALLSQAAERGILPLSFSSVSFPFLLLLWFSFPLFSLLSVLFFLSPFSLFRFFPFPSLSSVFFFVFSFFPVCSPPFPSVLGVLFIEPRAWLCCGAWGATGRSAIVSGRWAPGERVASRNSN